jgi:hypothetical protein
MPDTAAVIIATFSTVGFAITLAIPTLSAGALQLFESRGEKTIHQPAFRLLSKFAQTKWVAFFNILAAIYLLSGLLVILNYFITAYDFVPISMTLLLFSILATIAGTLSITVGSAIYSYEDVKNAEKEARRKFKEYYQASKKGIKKTRLQNHD